MSKYVDEHRESDRNLDNIVMLGDPLLYKTLVAVIKNIKVAAKKEKVLDGDKLHEPNVSLVIQLIDLELHENDMLVWNGQYNGTQLTVPGADCYMILPSLVDIEGKSCFAFDRSFIMDIGIHLQHQISKNGEPAMKKRKNDDPDKKECYVCKKTCPLKNMRAHVGQHILRKDKCGSNVCGYCGRGCNMILERSHKKKGQWFYRPKSVCPYFVNLRRIPQEWNLTNPCTNYILHCSVCGVCAYGNITCYMIFKKPTENMKLQNCVKRKWSVY